MVDSVEDKDASNVLYHGVFAQTPVNILASAFIFPLVKIVSRTVRASPDFFKFAGFFCSRKAYLSEISSCFGPLYQSNDCFLTMEKK